MKWIDFNSNLGSSQQLPPERHLVLVQIPRRRLPGGAELPPTVAVGYLRFAAGDVSCPYFVTPGVGGDAVAWSDCLPADFYAPLWRFPVAASTQSVEPFSPGTEEDDGCPVCDPDCLGNAEDCHDACERPSEEATDAHG